MKKTKIFQVKNVQEDKIVAYANYCKKEGLEQRVPLEKWLSKF